MNEPRKVLGRGLSSLIPNLVPITSEARPAFTQEPRATPPNTIAIGDIKANPRQPRRRFSETALEELSRSIKRHGILQPLVVRKSGAGYELIAGERRLRAAQLAGITHVPIVIRGSTDVDQLEIALVENLQREDLTPIEEAKGYDRLNREFGLSQDDIAQRVGKERSTITNLLRLLKLSSTVQDMVDGGAITMGHARALLPLEDSRRQEALANRIEKEGLSVRQIEEMVRTMLERASVNVRRSTDQKAKDPNLRHLSEDLQRSLGTRVEIVPKGKGGEVRIQYYSSEDLRRVSERILGTT